MFIVAHSNDFYSTAELEIYTAAQGFFQIAFGKINPQQTCNTPQTTDLQLFPA
jgi:hypothetical protein